MKKKFKLGLTLALTCLALVSLSTCGGQADESQQQLVEVNRGDVVLSVAADGELSLLWHRKLTFGTSGTITEINVEEGDKVTEGQVLASLDTTALELAVRTTELAVKAAEIDLELATNSYRKITYPYTYHTLVLDVPEALAAIGDAQRQLREAQEALEIGLGSDQYWAVWHQLKQAQDNLTEAKQKLARGRGEDVFGIGLIPITDYWTLRAAQIQMEKAQLAKETAQLALDEANNNLGKAVIVAPIEGIIATVNVKEGDKLSSMDYATKTIVDLIDPTSMELTAEVDEIDIPGVKLGQRAVISVDALPEEQFEGEVTSICPLPREEAGLVLYEVKIDFDVPQGLDLKVGMSATADIIINERSNVLLVPDRAIERDSQGNPMVAVMVDEQIVERSVVIGISDGFQTEIVDGLQEGEMVVVETRAKTEPTGMGCAFAE